LKVAGGEFNTESAEGVERNLKFQDLKFENGTR